MLTGDKKMVKVLICLTNRQSETIMVKSRK